jgi:hypothetical protein
VASSVGTQVTERARRRLAAGIVAIATAAASGILLAQSGDFQFVIAVADAERRPVTDLTRNDILMRENGIEHEIVKVEPFHMPVRLTLAVDNGPLSREALSHYRSGLTGLVKSLPPDVEVTLITTSPQPRMVVRPTTDRVQILRGINGFAPEDARPRFTDAIVEFSQRFQQELESHRRLDSVPVLVLVSTTANEDVSYEVPQIERAFGFLRSRKAKVYVTVTSTGEGSEGWAPLNSNRQALIGIPITKLTRGRYEALAISSRLATLLPEFGRDIATLHRKHANQLLVTARRPPELTGPIQNPRIEVRRQGLTGEVSLDGLP